MALMCAAKLIAESCELIDRDESHVPQVVFDKLRPSFYSYRSKDGGQYFDSVAMTTKGFGLSTDDCEKLRKHAPLKSRRLAAAAKAVLSR
jgi:hypothetical protein